MLGDFKKRQQRARRGARTSPGWDLYRSNTGKVPKDLVKMLVDVLPPHMLPESPPKGVLTEVENEALRQTLNFIHANGVRAARDVAGANQRPPVIERVKGSKLGLEELKFQSGMTNPRLLFCVCEGKAIFLAAFSKKQQKLRKKDIETAEKRMKILQKRGECK